MAKIGKKTEFDCERQIGDIYTKCIKILIFRRRLMCIYFAI